MGLTLPLVGFFGRLKKWGGGGQYGPPPRKKPLGGPKIFFLHKIQEQPLIDVLKVKIAVSAQVLVFSDRSRAAGSRNARFLEKSPIFHEKCRKIAVSNFL